MCVCVQVRLLTGIGRLYEMAYILQLLMENDQFESLAWRKYVCSIYCTLHTFTSACISASIDYITSANLLFPSK